MENVLDVYKKLLGIEEADTYIMKYIKYVLSNSKYDADVCGVMILDYTNTYKFTKDFKIVIQGGKKEIGEKKIKCLTSGKYEMLFGSDHFRGDTLTSPYSLFRIFIILKIEEYNEKVSGDKIKLYFENNEVSKFGSNIRNNYIYVNQNGIEVKLSYVKDGFINFVKENYDYIFNEILSENEVSIINEFLRLSYTPGNFLPVFHSKKRGAIFNINRSNNLSFNDNVFNCLNFIKDYYTYIDKELICSGENLIFKKKFLESNSKWFDNFESYEDCLKKNHLLDASHYIMDNPQYINDKLYFTSSVQYIDLFKYLNVLVDIRNNNIKNNRRDNG